MAGKDLSPFDSNKFALLLKGLNISIIKKSDMDIVVRFDAEYFKPEYLEIDRKFKSIENRELKQLLVKWPRYGLNVKNEYTKKGTKFIRGLNIKKNFLEGNILKIPYNIEDFSEQDLLKTEDLVIVRSGNAGDFGIITKEFNNSFCGSFVISFKLKLNSYFIFSFFQSKYGKKQIKRNFTGSIQTNINIPNLNIIKIPTLPEPFQLDIERLVKLSKAKKDKSNHLHQEAEQILLKELDLLDFEIVNHLTYTATKKEVDEAKRFDAEYFQPKYKEIEQKIENYKGGFEQIRNIASVINGSFIPESNYTKKGKRAYIRIKELSLNTLLNKEEMIFINDNFIRENETTVKENDFVIATIGATIGKINLIPKNFAGSFPSNNTSRIRLEKSHTYFYYYELLFRSMVFQKQIEREFTQTAQPKISNSQIEKIKIPLLEQKIQEQIANKIETSNRLREESKQLLEQAKNQVETEIERLAS